MRTKFNYCSSNINNKQKLIWKEGWKKKIKGIIGRWKWKNGYEQKNIT